MVPLRIATYIGALLTTVLTFVLQTDLDAEADEPPLDEIAR
jgi:hypothetical protein